MAATIQSQQQAAHFLLRKEQLQQPHRMLKAISSSLLTHQQEKVSYSTDGFSRALMLLANDNQNLMQEFRGD